MPVPTVIFIVLSIGLQQDKQIMRQWWLWLPLVSLCAVRCSAAEGTEVWWWSLVKCVNEDDTVHCISEKAIDIWRQQHAAAGRSTDSGENNSKDNDSKQNAAGELSSAIGDALFKEIGEMITVGVSRLLPFFGGGDDGDHGFSEEDVGDDEQEKSAEEEDDDDDDDGEEDGDPVKPGGKTGNNNRTTIVEGRGKKIKQKIHNLIVKILMLKMLMKQKVNNLLSGASVLLQLAFLGFLKINFLVNLVRLWLEFAKHKEPQKVVYYEHAQHHHEYDEKEHKPWSLFGSRNDADNSHELPYSSHIPPKPYIRYNTQSSPY